MRIFTLLCVVLIGCTSDREIDFVVHNTSQDPIDSVVVLTSTNSSRLFIDDIEPGSSKNGTLTMTKERYVDGYYAVSITAGTKTYRDRMGYFTNGGPFEEQIDIWFSADTIRYESKLEQKYVP
jgi:hypothetical protein